MIELVQYRRVRNIRVPLLLCSLYPGNQREEQREKEKEDILLSPTTKAPIPTENSEKETDNIERHQNVRLHIDYRTNSQSSLNSIYSLIQAV